MDVVFKTAAGSLLHHQSSLPQVPADHLYLSQVQSALDRSEHFRVLLFSAPAGFGKSAALASLAAQREERGHQVVWISLESADDDPVRFCTRLTESLAAALPGVGSDAESYLQNTLSVPVVAVMESLLMDLAHCEQPVLLVLDDFDRIGHEEILGGLNRLVQYAPPAFTLAIGSRSQPPLNLATWRAKGLLLEVGLEELRLSEEQTRDYFRRSGLELANECLRALYTQTEGWVIGVHLVSLWLRQQPSGTPLNIDALRGDQRNATPFVVEST